MEQEQVQELIDNAIKAVRDEFAETVLSLKTSGEQEQSEDATKAAEEAAAKQAEEVAAKDAEIEALKAKVTEAAEGHAATLDALKERVEKLSQKLTPARSRAIKSEDVEGQSSTETKSDRDSFGRKIR